MGVANWKGTYFAIFLSFFFLVVVGGGGGGSGYGSMLKLKLKRRAAQWHGATLPLVNEESWTGGLSVRIGLQTWVDMGSFDSWATQRGNN